MSTPEEPGHGVMVLAGAKPCEVALIRDDREAVENRRWFPLIGTTSEPVSWVDLVTVHDGRVEVLYRRSRAGAESLAVLVDLHGLLTGKARDAAGHPDAQRHIDMLLGVRRAAEVVSTWFGLPRPRWVEPPPGGVAAPALDGPTRPIDPRRLRPRPATLRDLELPPPVPVGGLRAVLRRVGRHRQPSGVR